MSTEGEVAAKEAHELHRALGPWQLIALGIGAIIGAGIFVITGHAAATYAGPGVVVSFMIAGLGCFFAGLCYAEFACMIPVAGSAYTYTYATMGRFLAWFIGWNLVLEYLAAASTVAVGWAGYLVQLLSQLGITIPRSVSSAPLAMTSLTDISFTGSILNLPAMAVVGIATTMLVIGIKASAQFNAVMVVIKLVIVVLVIGFGLPLIMGDNLEPFIPPNTGTWGEFGWSGVFRATGVIFFAYIGFDAVSVAAQEARNPQRDMPIGILGSLLICTRALHPDVAHDDGLGALHLAQRRLPGVRRDQQRGPAARLARLPRQCRRGRGPRIGRARVAARPVARVLCDVARRSDPAALLPNPSDIPHAMDRHDRDRNVRGAACRPGPAQHPGRVGLDRNAARVRDRLCGHPDLARRATELITARSARPPCGSWRPLGMAMCIFMMAFLPLDTWLRLLVWTLIGLVIYFTYGKSHAKPPQFVLSKQPAE